MSKETFSKEAIDCNCGQKIAFPQYHMPHCKAPIRKKVTK